jgi:hypothetical protein
MEPRMNTNKHEFRTEDVTRIARILAYKIQVAAIGEISVKTFVSIGVHSWF